MKEEKRKKNKRWKGTNYWDGLEKLFSEKMKTRQKKLNKNNGKWWRWETTVYYYWTVDLTEKGLKVKTLPNKEGKYYLLF